VSDPLATLTERARRRVGTSLRRDKYRIDGLLGVGSTGAVYAATHRNGMRVAIKLLHAELSRVLEIRSRFLREGYIANRVQHPSLVRVLDDDVDDDGSTFLVMELLEGTTLAAVWEAAGHTLPVGRVGAIVDALLDVLAAIHAQGIVHRDIKPENVFLTSDGLKLLDLGIARLVESRVTASGQMMGTPEYVAPEQAAGDVDQIDARTDLYALGALAFALLTGHVVHDARSAMEAMVFAATRPARAIRDVWADAPPALADVVDRALRFDRTERWSSADDMRAALRGAMAGPGAAAAQRSVEMPEMLEMPEMREPAAAKAQPPATAPQTSTVTVVMGSGASASSSPPASAPIPLVRPKRPRPEGEP
jgi:serine/threonine protein kinase